MYRVKLLLVMALTVVSGCTGSSAMIKANNASVRTNIFEELTNNGPVSPGFADLRVTATLKTHKPGIYSSTDIHGTPDYMLLLNIDGQAVLLRGALQKEYSEPRGLVDPEAGDGIRYRFSKSLRLKTGTHRIFVALSDDGITVERELTLSDKSKNSLVVEPIYGALQYRPGSYGVTSFTEGLKQLRLTLNGLDI